MKIFIDSADTEIIASCFNTGLVDGLTTNPSLIRKSGRKHEDVYQELKDIGLNDISMEVIGSKENMISEGKRLHKKFGKCATIKVPCTPDGLRACAELSETNIRVNVTLIFSASQAILAAKAGATYVSPFVGRLNDNSFSGVAVVQTIVGIFREHTIKTQVLAASVREVHTVGRCFAAGADIVTMPPNVFEGMYKHILTDKGLDIFDKDHAATIAKLNSDLTRAV
jgi:transaldolase